MNLTKLNNLQKTVLVIAGSDPSGGAGIQADLKTLTSFGVYGMTAITALTEQNSNGVFDILEIPIDFVVKQINCCLSDINANAVKIGMLHSADLISAVLEALLNNNILSNKKVNIVLDPVMVEAYGNKTPINQVGTVNVPEPRMVTINVWDKSLVELVDKAIRESGLGINPQMNGTLIMLPIPELNEERRRELSKVAAQYAEQARISIRNIRKDGMDQVKKYKSDGMSEDDQKFWEGEVQEMTDDYVKRIDSLLHTKQDEIMQV